MPQSSSNKVKVSVREWEDVVILDHDKTAAFVEMLRQRSRPNSRDDPQTTETRSESSTSSTKSKKKLSRNMTLAIISLDQGSRSPSNIVEPTREPSPGAEKKLQRPEIPAIVIEKDPTADNYSVFSCLKDRPLWRLFMVMFINGMISFASSGIVILIEKPAQDQRLKDRAELLMKIDGIKTDINARLDDPNTDPDMTITKLNLLTDTMADTVDYPDEIPWDLLSAQSFITSIQTTTGYGDIVPVTTGGKVFTLFYALVGIPVFMWYIVKLGGLFRLLTMYIFSTITNCFCPSEVEEDEKYSMEQYGRRQSTLEIILFKANSRIKEQFFYDKRFHPSVIGGILLVFLLSVAYFIAYMEGYKYFDAFYACFITYSTIGFGDIDIFRVSYRSNWFNFMIYGNFIHILGYMILSAWIASILEKVGVRKF